MPRMIDADALKEKILTTTFTENNMWALNLLIGLIDDIPTDDAWISVKDRLPESRHAVLVYTPHYKNIWAVSMHEDGNWYIWSPNGRVLLDPDWHGPITHWMPFPEPPKENEHGNMDF